MIKIPSDYIALKSRRINTAQRQDCKYVLLSIEYECELLLKQEFLMGTENMCVEDE